MTHDDQKAAVAVSLKDLLSALSKAVTAIVKSDRHQVVIVVRAGGVAQAAASVNRREAVTVLKELLLRWEHGPSDLPPIDAPRGAKRFEYLLNAMELAAQASEPAVEGYADKRRAVLAYVAMLESGKGAAETPAGQEVTHGHAG